MKLRNLLLTATLFLAASFAFAGHTQTAHESLSWDNPGAGSTLNVTLFPMNNGWTYYVAGYDADNNLISGTRTKLDAEDSTVLVNKYTSSEDVNAYVLPDAFSASEQAEIKQYTHGIYEFAVSFSAENIDHYGIIATHPHEISTVFNVPKNQGADYFSLIHNDAGIVYYGKGQLAYNNGGIFLVDVNQPETVGNPLPAPAVTLLIALAFGAAFVMYRNRKQVKA